MATSQQNQENLVRFGNVEVADHKPQKVVQLGIALTGVGGRCWCAIGGAWLFLRGHRYDSTNTRVAWARPAHAGTGDHISSVGGVFGGAVPHAVPHMAIGVWVSVWERSPRHARGNAQSCRHGHKRG